MKIIKPTMVILALAQGILYGDIYDTDRELRKKYGAPIEVDEYTRVFHWKDYRVECIMFQLKMRPHEQPKCVAEKITRLDNKPFTMLDLRTVLPTTTVGGEWTQHDHNNWRTRFAQAHTQANNTQVVIRTAERE